jgi:hypothetical protein
MADNPVFNETLKKVSGLTEEQIEARREQKAELVASREKLTAIEKEMKELGINTKNNSRFLKMQNDLAKDEAKFEKVKFTQMIKDKARGARDALVSAPGKAMSFIGKGVEKTMGGLGKMFKGLIGATGIFGGMLLLFKALQNPEFREKVKQLWEFVKGVFTNTFDFFLDAFTAISTLISSITDRFGVLFSEDATWWEKIQAFLGIFKDIGTFFFDIFDSLTENVANMFGLSFAPHKGLGSWLVAKIKETWQTIKDWFTGAATWFVDGYTNIKNWIVNKVITAWANVKAFFIGAAEWVVDGYTNIKDWIVSKVTAAWTNIKNFFIGAAEWVVDGATNIKDWVVSKVTGAWSKIKEWFSGTAEFIVEGATGLKDFISNAASTGWSSVKAWFSGKAEMAKEDFTNFGAFVGDKVQLAQKFADDLFTFTEEDMTAKGITGKLIDTVGVGVNLGVNFAKGIFKFGDQKEPFKLSEFLIGEEGVMTKVGGKLASWGKKIYDPETGAIFGMTIPELPSLSKMFDGIKNLAKKIYDPETGAIFGMTPGKIFDFELPNISDMLMNAVGSMLPDPDGKFGWLYRWMPNGDTLKAAAKAFKAGGSIEGGSFVAAGSEGGGTDTSTEAGEELTAEDIELIAKEEELMRKAEELKKLQDQKTGAPPMVTVITNDNKQTQISNSKSTVTTQKQTEPQDETMKAVQTISRGKGLVWQR